MGRCASPVRQFLHRLGATAAGQQWLVHSNISIEQADTTCLVPASHETVVSNFGKMVPCKCDSHESVQHVQICVAVVRGHDKQTCDTFG